MSADDLVWKFGGEILESPAFLREKEFAQHGKTSTYDHSVRVARLAVKIARKTRLTVDYHSLVRGCLLHDYCLYDWHIRDASHRFHGLRHGKTARKNAERDFGINFIEHNMIQSHMFPFCLALPIYKESFLVGLADKLCSAGEVIHRK